MRARKDACVVAPMRWTAGSHCQCPRASCCSCPCTAATAPLVRPRVWMFARVWLLGRGSGGSPAPCVGPRDPDWAGLPWSDLGGGEEVRPRPPDAVRGACTPAAVLTPPPCPTPPMPHLWLSVMVPRSGWSKRAALWFLMNGALPCSSVGSSRPPPAPSCSSPYPPPPPPTPTRCGHPHHDGRPVWHLCHQQILEVSALDDPAVQHPGQAVCGGPCRRRRRDHH